MNLVAINNKQLAIFERRNIEGNNYLVRCSNLSDLFKKLPDGNNKVISRITMENEILRYNLKNINKLKEDDIFKDSNTKFYEFNTIYELYLYVMLNS